MTCERTRLDRATAVVALVLSAGLFLQGCSGNGGASSESGLDEEAFPRLQPGNRPVRFRLDTAVSKETQDFLVETLSWAHLDMGDSGPLTLHVYSDENHFVDAYTNEFAISPQEARAELDGGQFVLASPGGHVWVYLPNFEADPIPIRRFSIFHEYFHTVQHWLSEIRFQSTQTQERSFVPRWLVEGSAEYLAVTTSARRGLVDEADERAVKLALAKLSSEPLTDLETGGEAGFLGGSGSAYSVGYLACERLATTYGPDKLSRQFWVSLAKRRNWDAAFSETFGAAPATFYADFEVFRRTW